MPIRLDPFFYPFDGPLQFLARGAPLDARYSFPVFHPEEFKTNKGESSLHSGVKTAEPHYLRLLRRCLQVEFLQPFRQLPVKTLCVIPQLEGANPIIGKATYHRFSSALGFDYLLEPEIQGKVQIHIGQDRRDDSPLRGTGVWIDDGAICLQYAGLQPFPDQVEERPVVYPQSQHL